MTGTRSILLVLLFAASAAPCGYHPPPLESIITGVPIHSEHAHRHRRDSSPSSPAHWQPMRIHVHYDESVRALDGERQEYVNSTLIPSAVEFWQEALAVRPLGAPIRLARSCASGNYLYSNRTRNCFGACSESPKCGEVVIPKQHLMRCDYCLNQDASSCRREGESGPGVPHADFLLYVSAYQTDNCDQAETLAYAAHCQQEESLDRPVAGHINICPSAISTHGHDQESLIATAKHELLHALGFAANLYAYFRDDNGKPRTKRNKYGIPDLGRKAGHYVWGRSTGEVVLRTDWWTHQGPVTHPVHVMRTPRVVREARAHFGCATLEGAEIENQGGIGTAYSHWEKRLFENEAMTGTHTQNPVYSRLTLALLEDSGWYRANYSMAEELHWGKGLGCDFAAKSCGHWINERREKGLAPTPFCDRPKHDGEKTLAVTSCTLQRDSLGVCNLVPMNNPLDTQYQNFAWIKGIRPEGIVYYGGKVDLADYCPFNQEFTWNSADNVRRDSRCDIEGNIADDSMFERYGQSSRCIDFDSAWTMKKCGRTRTFKQFMAGCYEHSCSNGTLHIGVGGKMYPCYKEGQRIHINRLTSDNWLVQGALLCPACDELCSDCDVSSTSSEVLLDDDAPPPEPWVGDDLIDEDVTCSSCSTSILLLLLLTLLIHDQ